MKEAIVTLTIDKPGSMSWAARLHIVQWLENQASKLLTQGESYNDTGPFTATYNIKPRKKSKQ